MSLKKTTRASPEGTQITRAGGPQHPGGLEDLKIGLDLRATEILAKVKSILSRSSPTLGSNIPAAQTIAAVAGVGRDAFVSKYGFHELDRAKVAFTLPSNHSFLDLLEDAQSITPTLYGKEAFSSYSHEALAEGGGWVGFTWKDRAPRSYMIDACVPRACSEFQRPEIAALVAAHAACLVATGRDLFCGNSVEAQRGVLEYLPNVGVVPEIDERLLRTCYPGFTDTPGRIRVSASLGHVELPLMRFLPSQIKPDPIAQLARAQREFGGEDFPF